MQVTLSGDASGRVAATIAHNGAHATVTGLDSAVALAELHFAVEEALANGLGECYWHETLAEVRWLFRREGEIVRVAVIRSTGVVTGWEYCLWCECPVDEFAAAMHAAVEGFPAPQPQE